MLRLSNNANSLIHFSSTCWSRWLSSGEFACKGKNHTLYGFSLYTLLVANVNTLLHNKIGCAPLELSRNLAKFLAVFANWPCTPLPLHFRKINKYAVFSLDLSLKKFIWLLPCKKFIWLLPYRWRSARRGTALQDCPIQEVCKYNKNIYHLFMFICLIMSMELALSLPSRASSAKLDRRAVTCDGTIKSITARIAQNHIN